jgi:hypothetical protein
MRKELLYLAKHGLVQEEELRFFKSAIKKAEEDKRLTLIEYELITKTFTKLLSKIFDDTSIYNKLKKRLYDD